MLRVMAVATMTVGVAGVALFLDQTEIPLRSRTADAWRVFVMAQAGIALGLLGAIVWQMGLAKISPKDRLIRPLAMVGCAYFLMTLFIGFELAGRWNQGHISWRTPLAMAAFFLSDFGLLLLMLRVGRAVHKSQETGGSVKLTITDTSRPGPDIDLETSGHVTTNPPTPDESGD